MIDLQIEASTEELEDLRQFLIQEMGDKIDLQEISSVAPGELREPILIGLVVALGGPVIVKGFVDVVKRWLEHQEKMKALEFKHDEKMTQLKFSVLRDVGSEQISLDEVPSLATGPHKKQPRT